MTDAACTPLPVIPHEAGAPDAIWLEWGRQKALLRESLRQHFDDQERLLGALLTRPEAAGQQGSRRISSAAGPEVAVALEPPPDDASPGFCLVADSSAQCVDLDRSLRLGRTTSSLQSPARPSGSSSSATSGGRSSSDDVTARHTVRPGVTFDISRRTRQRKTLLKFLQESTDVIEHSLMARWLPEQLIDMRSWWMRLEEPVRHGCLERIVRHRAFDVMVATTILANACFTAYQANYEMEHLGVRAPESAIADGVFLAIFALEFLAKLALHRGYFFVNDEMSWNWFDLVLVSLATLDYVFSDSDLVKVSFARSLRIFKMGKVLRVFRTMRFLKELRVMVTSIVGSLVSLGWSVVMLGLILFVFALFFVQQMAMHLSDSELFDESPLFKRQRKYFRSVQVAMATLSMCTTGGKDWEEVFELVVPLGLFSTVAFVFYIAFFTFAVMNILTGIFVENALSLCKPSEIEALTMRKRQDEQEAEELFLILETLDGDGDGCMSMDEFRQVMTNDRVVHMLKKLGVDIKDAELFFSTVARLSHQDIIEIPEFVTQIMRLKGNALSMDLHALIVQTHCLQQSFEQNLEKKFRELREEQQEAEKSDRARLVRFDDERPAPAELRREHAAPADPSSARAQL